MSRELPVHEVVLPCGEKVRIREMTWRMRCDLLDGYGASEDPMRGVTYERKLLETSVTSDSPIALDDLTVAEAKIVEAEVMRVNGLADDAGKNA